ncbi:putative ribosomal N-acetyltransferase YdaF [Phycisphaerae bacterium RAS1]|nr:putative ribosomal N-acetyltransferase YdaF [Phycisphaerae bacterium RAS1]
MFTNPIIPVTLAGRHVRLAPLTLEHAPGLLAAGRDEPIWTWLIREPLRSVDDARGYISDALEQQARGTQLAFVTLDAACGEVIGSTRYLNILPADRVLEIGWTWLSVARQRTAANTECKYLLLRHAFETLGALRVQLKTDLLNEKSQRAIERIGGLREGVLRRYQATRGGRQRDTVMYSILSEEWPAVKARLERLLVG